MFVCSVRASTLRFVLILVLSVAILGSVLIIGSTRSASYSASSGSIDFSGIKTNEERLEFISKFIPEISGEPKESVTFSVPESFDRIMLSYNEIQKQQGLDITKYKNKKVTRYTYELQKYEDYDGPVYVNLVIYRGTVIACDVSSADPTGFIKPLVNLE